MPETQPPELMRRFLPYGRQTIEADDLAAVAEALQSDFLTTGPRVEAFEQALAETTGAGHAVVCNSGTAALHLAALALRLGPGDQVIVPAVTFLATANAPRLCGAEIVFADVDPDTALMRPEDLEDALARAPRARACFAVHMNGQACDLETLSTICERRGISLVDDACHALGATYGAKGGPGRIGDGRLARMSAFSFHPVKAIAMGEGGAVTTNDPALAERCRRMRNHGMSRDPSTFSPDFAPLAFGPDGRANPWIYEMDEPGFNYRAPDILCALGLSQLRKLDRFLARRRQIAERYDARLADLAPRARPLPRTPRGRSGWHLYVALIDFEGLDRDRARVMRALAERGVGTQVHYLPVHLQPYYRRLSPDLILPGAMAYYRRALSLPIQPSMSDEDVDYVVDSLGQVLFSNITAPAA